MKRSIGLTLIVLAVLCAFALVGCSKEQGTTAAAAAPAPAATTQPAPVQEAKTEEKPAGDTESAVLAEKKATAKKLLERGMSKEEVSEITGLSIEEIEE